MTRAELKALAKCIHLLTRVVDKGSPPMRTEDDPALALQELAVAMGVADFDECSTAIKNRPDSVAPINYFDDPFI